MNFNRSPEWQQQFNDLIAAGKANEALEMVNRPVSAVPAQISQPAQAAPPIPQQPNLEQRVAQLEQIIQKVAAPAIDEAAKVGMAIMSALGNGMSHDQAAFVQSRLNSSPEFFASQGCKDAIDIFIAEWKNYDGSKKK
jgi:hypothetical protein